MSDYSLQRQHMIDRQLRARSITDDRVLAAMNIVPREWFVPPDLRDHAYDDSALAIGCDQTISQPYIVGLSTQALRVSAGHRVLEIGTGSGYQTAILAELGAEEFTVERISELSLRARAVLDAQGYERVHFRIADGTLGWPEEAPFDRILVAATAPELPRSLFAQLKEAGRMVIPIGSVDRQTLQVISKLGGQPTVEELCGCLFVKLVGKEGWAEPLSE